MYAYDESIPQNLNMCNGQQMLYSELNVSLASFLVCIMF